MLINEKKFLGVLIIASLGLITLNGNISFGAVCEKDLPFEPWLNQIKQEARQQGVSENTLAIAAPYLKIDPEIIKRDRSQSVFLQTFIQFSDRMVSEARIKKAHQLLKTHADLFAKIEKDFGVPPQPILAFWGLESDFGAVTGKYPILTAVTSLAYDCRRPALFRPQVIAALKLLERKDLNIHEMTGAWAGELGGTQFMPADYLESGVDYDGDGKVNLVKSIPDTLATAANFLRHHGWKPNNPWLQEVKLPEDLPWDQADLTIQLPLNQWLQWKVIPLNGQTAKSNPESILLLPMGRLGPGFVAYPNFKAFLGWNSSLLYSTTAAYFATRLLGAPQVQRARPELKPLSLEQMMEVQSLLIKRGYDLGDGGADGKLGAATRLAVKQAQQKLGLPADSYPTLEMLEKLRR